MNQVSYNKREHCQAIFVIQLFLKKKFIFEIVLMWKIEMYVEYSEFSFRRI
jgi:hypothetical protein